MCTSPHDIYIHLLGKYLLLPLWGWDASTLRKDERRAKKMKRIEARRLKRPTPSWAIDGFIKDEEQNRKYRKEKHREQAPNTTAMDHLVASYDLFGLYGEPESRCR